MTQFFAYAGVGLGNTHIRLNGSVHDGIPGVTQNADGTYATGGATVDDPTGAMSHIELQQFTFDETACSRQRVFTGYLSNMRVSRGPYLTGPGRIYEFDLLDLNYLLHLRPLRGTSAKRPAETGNARLAWLLSSIALSGIVYDNGFVGNNPNNFDAADYTDQYSEAVLSDLCVSSSSEIGRIFFVYRDNTTGQASLFIDIPTVTTHTSTLSISNTNSDLSATCFAPFKDAELSASGEDIYCGVIFKYKTGTVYAHNATTHATYFAGTTYHREAVFETTRIGTVDTANRHANAYLANHNGTIDTVTCMIQVPSSQVNLLEAGMRVSCKFSDLQGYEGPIYLRVSSRTVVPTAGNPDQYDLHLTLSNKSLTPIGGGGTGGFPNPPASPPAIVQHKFSNIVSRLTPDSPVADGDTLLMWMVNRGTIAPPSLPTGWTSLDTMKDNGVDGFGDLAAGRLMTKIAASEPAIYTTGFDWNSEAIFVEMEAGTTIDNHVTSDVLSSASVVLNSGGAITPSAANSVVMGFALVGEFFGVSVVPAAGVTEIEEGGRATPPDAPSAWAGYKDVATATSSVITGTVSGAAGHLGSGGVTVVLLGAASQNPPVSGQWVGISPPEVVVMSGVNGTTAFPFANGSLRVFYDIVEQTAAIVSYDGGAGTFVMPSAPPLGTQVFVQYQAI